MAVSWHSYNFCGFSIFNMSSLDWMQVVYPTFKKQNFNEI